MPVTATLLGIVGAELALRWGSIGAIYAAGLKLEEK
jgi:hypothetical protein